MVLEPPSRTAESSASADQRPREQTDDADMSDPESDTRKPRELFVKARATKRVKLNVLVDEKAVNGWRPKKNGSTVVSARSVLNPTTLKSNISRSREFIVCNTKGRERRIVNRWGDKETCQDLPQELTGITRFRKSWVVLSEQTKPPIEGDLSPNLKGDILDIRPTSQQRLISIRV